MTKKTNSARRFARQPKAEGKAEAATASTPAPSSAPAAAGKRPNKTEAVIALLGRPEGATIADLVEATSWLPHTTRAALTGLKKKGKVITKAKRGDVTCYFIASPAA